jgi:hypothetical protein
VFSKVLVSLEQKHSSVSVGLLGWPSSL